MFVVLVTLPVAAWLLSPLQWADLGKAAGSALLYVSNFVFSQQATDYFAAAGMRALLPGGYRGPKALRSAMIIVGAAVLLGTVVLLPETAPFSGFAALLPVVVSMLSILGDLSSSKTVVLVGDSHSSQWKDALGDAAK